MSDHTIIFFLCLCLALLVGVVLYQQFTFHSGIQSKLRTISGKLKEPIDMASGERVRGFTDNKDLMELAAQIHRRLENHTQVKADYRRSEIAAQKLLSNIEHAI